MIAEIIARAQAEQSNYLDLGNLGLNGTEPELAALGDCHNLTCLNFAAEWWRTIAYAAGGQNRQKHESQNKGKANQLVQLPEAMPPHIKQLFLAESAKIDKKNKKIQQQISQLQILKELDLYGCQITNIDFLASLQSIEVLTLTDNNLSQIDALKPLSGLKNLKYLIANAAKIKKITALADLTALKNVLLWSNSISDISPLSGLQDLEELMLGCNNNIVNIEPLQGLHKLKTLQLWANKVQNIQPLRDLIKLEDLNLSDNKISDISILANMQELQLLYLDYNLISDISVLADKQKIWHLMVDISKLKKLPAYPLLRVLLNPKPSYKAATTRPTGDFKDVIEPPFFDKIWNLLLAKGQENQDLAQQLSIGAGWDKFFFETYQAAARFFR